MSSQGSRRNPPGNADRPGHRRLPRLAPPPAPPPNALFAEMLRAARELLAVRSPLDAELMVSEILGTWYGQREPGVRPGGGTDLEELIGEGLVEYAAQQESPAALALLSGVACLGTARQAAQAEKAALALIEAGVPRPSWAERVGAVRPAECYLNPDAYGDCDEVVCLFSYAGTEPHALVTLVDYNAGGMLRDGWVTSRTQTLLEHGRQTRDTAPQHPARNSFGPIRASDARYVLEAALTVTDTTPGPPAGASFPAYHAFIRARIRTLPPGRPAPPRVRVPYGGPFSRLAGPEEGPAWIGARARRQAWSTDRRAMLVVEFLASDEAEDLSDRGAASRCADHIIGYGCDQDFGRPLRVSPSKVEAFLLGWLPRKIMLTAAEQHAMPHVLAAWVRWAGARRGLAPTQIEETLDAVFSALGTFGQVYQDPVTYGLDPQVVARLLPDSDLEALPRRTFAFPLLQGRYRDTDLATLDPSDPQARRVLLAADHEDGHGHADAQHIDRHLVLSDRLWRGDPPELWEAAQRMLDRGEDRHAVQHTLMYLIRDAGDDAGRLADDLARLP